MGGWRGFVAGFFGLVVLGGLLRAEQTGRVRPSGLLGVAANGIERLLSARVPAIADRRGGGQAPASFPYAGQAVARSQAAAALGRRVRDPSIIRKRRGA